ncbi:phosphatase/phosphohexomutase [gut metagenome]|uniref:Phosphatase/phosphohexomutase n=1 Tax=gut metagenome TaxID=749906 RepID=J9CK72_9ZZZZ
MDTDRTTTHFNTIAYHIVSISQYICRISIQLCYIAGLRRSKRMVHSHQAAFFFTPFEHREVNDPKKSELILITQTETTTHFEAQFAQLAASLHSIIATENQNQIASLGTHSLFQGIEHISTIELVYRTLDAAIFVDSCIHHTLSTNLLALDEISQFIQLLASIGSTTFSTNTTDISGIVKYSKFALALEHIHQFNKFHAETHIRFV